MLLICAAVSNGGNEITIKSEFGDKFCISKADAVRQGLYDTEDYPKEYEDAEYLEFLTQKLKALKYCKYLLTFSDKSSKQLIAKLREKEYPKEVCDEALKVLKESGISDESAMCERKLKSLAVTKLYGPHRIKAELKAKGFCGEDIENAFAECDIDFEENCKKLAFKLLDNADIETCYDEAVEKIKAKLSRYGYGFSEIRSAINTYFAG